METFKFTATFLYLDYKPDTTDLTIGDEVKWVYHTKIYHTELPRFQADKNPHGDNELVDILELALAPDGSALEVVVEAPELTRLQVSGTYPYHNIAYRWIADHATPKLPLLVKKGDDGVRLVLDNGQLQEFNYSSREDLRGKSFVISYEEGTYVLIRFLPFKREKIVSFSLKDKRITCLTEAGEFKHSLTMNDALYKLLDELFQSVS